jgi:hypothetical protein
MVDYPYDENKSADYNYEAGYLAGLRAILRLAGVGQATLTTIIACVKEQKELMDGGVE